MFNAEIISVDMGSPMGEGLKARKRMAMRGGWQTPPSIFRNKLTAAKSLLNRLSLDEATSPRSSLIFQNALEERKSKDKAQQSKVSLIPGKIEPGRRIVGLAVSGGSDEHSDPLKQSVERCTRISSIIKALDERMDLGPFMVNLSESPRIATEAELLTVHTKGYLAKLNRLIAKSSTENQMSKKALDSAVNESAKEEFDSVYMSSKSLEAAKSSAGAALECIDSLCNGFVDTTVAAIRPPGHHAESHCAMGFCFFNNAALVVKRALEVHGLKRVLIVDQDIHHGNGTQRAFWDDERVLYFSVHRWDKGKFYPHNEVEPAPTTVGPKDSPAAGKTVNVAFCNGEMGDLEYQAVWSSVLLPIMKEFQPELIVISAGFDAAEGDPVGKYHVSPSCFGAMTFSIATCCPKAKIAMLLEGGYNVNVTAESFCNCVEALTLSSDENNKKFNWPGVSRWPRVKHEAVDAINATISAQQAYWSSLKPVAHFSGDGGKTLITLD